MWRQSRSGLHRLQVSGVFARIKAVQAPLEEFTHWRKQPPSTTLSRFSAQICEIGVLFAGFSGFNHNYYTDSPIVDTTFSNNFVKRGDAWGSDAARYTQ